MNALTCPRCLYSIPPPDPTDGGDSFHCPHCLRRVPNPFRAAGEKARVSGDQLVLSDTEGDTYSYSLEELRRHLRALEGREE